MGDDKKKTGKLPAWMKDKRILIPAILAILLAAGFSITMTDGKLKVNAEIDLKEAAGLLAVDAGDEAEADPGPMEVAEDDDSATP